MFRFQLLRKVTDQIKQLPFVTLGFSEEKEEKLWGKKFFIYSKRCLSFHRFCKEESKFSYGYFWYSKKKQGITNPRCRIKYALLQKNFHTGKRNMQIKI